MNAFLFYKLTCRDANLLTTLERPENLTTNRNNTFLHIHNTRVRRRDRRKIGNQLAVGFLDSQRAYWHATITARKCCFALSGCHHEHMSHVSVPSLFCSWIIRYCVFRSRAEGIGLVASIQWNTILPNAVYESIETTRVQWCWWLKLSLNATWSGLHIAKSFLKNYARSVSSCNDVVLLHTRYTSFETQKMSWSYILSYSCRSVCILFSYCFCWVNKIVSASVAMFTTNYVYCELMEPIDA